jgi:hypothetical protein
VSGLAHSPIVAEALERHRQARFDHAAYVEGYVARAEHECHGFTVSARGRARGASTYDLFAGPGALLRFRAWATDELREFVASHPFLSLTEWERQHLDLYLPPKEAAGW